MTIAEALEVVAMLRGFFPSWRMEDTDAALWAKVISKQPYDFVDGIEAAFELAEGTYPPRSPGEVISAMYDARRDRPIPALPAPEVRDAMSLRVWLDTRATSEQIATVERIGLERLVAERLAEEEA